MAKIKSIHGLEILDSRGNPTIEVILTTDSGTVARAKIPSGASTGEHEAIELRDHDPKRYGGKGVLKAVDHVNGPIQKLLIGFSVFDQEKIDRALIDADGTPNKALWGANAILGCSLATAMAAAQEKKTPLYAYLSEGKGSLLPCPMMNILNGGVHGDNLLEIQEFMVRPIGAPSFKEGLRWGVEVFHSLKKLLKGKKYSTSVGDEGGFAPQLSSNEEALEFILEAITSAGYKPGKEVTLALDLAASEFYDPAEGKYVERKKKKEGLSFLSRTSQEHVSYISSLCSQFPIDSIEDGMDQNDWEGWKLLTKTLGKKIQIVGDDLFVTQSPFLKRGIQEKAANAILIKLNQVGTLTETWEAIRLAQQNGFSVVISHRSGETEDAFIADLAVACGSGQIKTGSLSRSERTCKFNRLLEIEDELGKRAKYYRS